MRTDSRALGAAVTAAAAGALVLASAVPAAAAEGDVIVTNRETVSVLMSPSGEVKTSRVYDQLAAYGTGTVEVANPVATEGLRNLDGFGGFEVVDGEAVATLEVDGEKRVRTVSEFEGEIPVEIDVEITLDGEAVEPGDVVGSDGRLEVVYTVTNTTGTPTELTHLDGSGQEVTATVEVPLPIVGSLSTTLPSNFTAVSGEGASVAGDGRGGTRLSWTMTLFPPIGSNTAQARYSAQVVDGVVPKVALSLLPISPFDNPSLSKGAASLKSGAETGQTLTAGATEIDANLLKLRDGASELVSGLLLLRNGAGELSDGLQDRAVPGSLELAEGLQDAKTGSRELADGLGDLSSGAGRLSTGLGTAAAGSTSLATGSQTLAAGLASLSSGLDQLAAVDGLPAAKQGLEELRFGISHAPGTLGPTDRGGLLEGITALADGLASLGGGVTGLKQYCAAITDPTTKAQCDGTADKVLAGIGTLEPGAQALEAGVANQVLPGVDKLLAGLTRAVGGVQQAAAGARQLSAGGQQLSAGAGALASGLGQLQAGGAELSAGAGRAAAGGGTLADGLVAAADGSAELADGLVDAGDGSGRLAEGLAQAAEGAPAIPEGASRLSAEGTQQLIAAGNDTSLNYGQQYAVIEASAAMVEDGGMPYGAPQDAIGSAAYSIELAAAAGEGAKNTGRAIAGVVLLAGAAAGATVLARRRRA